MVRVAVQVEEGRAGAGGQRAQDAVVTALADVDHALEDHGAIVAHVASVPASGDAVRQSGDGTRSRGPLPARPVLLGGDGV